MPRERTAAIGPEEPQPTREDRWLAKLNLRCLDVALGAIPLPLRVLDVGCGYGDLLRECAERLPNVLEVVGVDPDEDLLGEARLLAGSSARFLNATAEDLPFADDHFDLIFAVRSFREWRNERRGLAEIARVLQPGGVFVLADPPSRAIPASLAAAGLRLVRRETLMRRFGVPDVQAFLSSK